MQQIQITADATTLLDDDDHALLSSVRWFYDRGYAVRMDQTGGRNRKVYMHRVITGAERGEVVDHINGNTLDNRKGNLRRCSMVENSQNQRIRKDNRSGYRGVSWCSQTQRWRACIVYQKKRLSLGRFDAPEDAAAAYDKAATELYGEHARLNFKD